MMISGRAAGLIAALVLAGLLAACASTTLSADECRAADWRAIGVEDGRGGQPASYFARYVEECAAAAAPDRAAWSAGREDGLFHYCTPQGAYAAGREGRAYSGVCPDPVDPVILEANNHGLTWARMRARIRELERLDSNFNRGCPTGSSRFDCGFGAGVFVGSPGGGWDPRVQAELRELRREIVYYASWPPPGGGTVQGF